MPEAQSRPLTADVDPRSDAVEALLQRCAARDRKAFEELYRVAAPRLLACLLAILRKRDLAEDALQDVMVRIWQRAGQFDGYRGRPMAWLVSIARYHAIDRLRSRHPLVAIDAAIEARLDDARALEVIDEAESGRTHYTLERCLQLLSPEQRRCVVLAYSHGCSHGEIASTLASPLGTVKSWTRRGLSALRRCLES
jgi:RNA polymerase sigma-70 factor (ECF subfamily)